MLGAAAGSLDHHRAAIQGVEFARNHVLPSEPANAVLPLLDTAAMLINIGADNRDIEERNANALGDLAPGFPGMAKGIDRIGDYCAAQPQIICGHRIADLVSDAGIDSRAMPRRQQGFLD